MTHVEENFVLLPEHVQERDGQFNRAEIGGKVSAVGFDDIKNVLPEFPGQYVQFIEIQFFEVGRTVDFL